MSVAGVGGAGWPGASPGHAEVLHTISQGPGWSVPDLILWTVVGAGFAVYLSGWLRARRNPRLASGRHLAAYLSAVLLLGLALLGPLDRASDRALAPHMVQHMILVMAVPPLFLAARSYPIGLWGLPEKLRASVGGWLATGGFARRVLVVASPMVAFGATALVHVVWHDPGLYDAAIRNGSVHALQHVTFFGSALAWWWHGLRAAPRMHAQLSTGVRMIYLMGMAPVAMMIGMFIAFAPEPLYSTYVIEAARLGRDALTDQQWGGAILWVMGGMMYLLAGLAGLAQDLSNEDRHTVANETSPPSAAAKPLPVRLAAG